MMGGHQVRGGVESRPRGAQAAAGDGCVCVGGGGRVLCAMLLRHGVDGHHGVVCVRDPANPRAAADRAGDDDAGTCSSPCELKSRHTLCVLLALVSWGAVCIAVRYRFDYQCTQLEFLDFRDVLFPASGFQSVQFRLVEVSATAHVCVCAVAGASRCAIQNKLGLARDVRISCVRRRRWWCAGLVCVCVCVCGGGTFRALAGTVPGVTHRT